MVSRLRLGSLVNIAHNAAGPDCLHRLASAPRAVRSLVNIAHNAAGPDCLHRLASAPRAVRSLVNIAHNAAGPDCLHRLASAPRAVRSLVNIAHNAAGPDCLHRLASAPRAVRSLVNIAHNAAGPDCLHRLASAPRAVRSLVITGVSFPAEDAQQIDGVCAKPAWTCMLMTVRSRSPSRAGVKFQPEHISKRPRGAIANGSNSLALGVGDYNWRFRRYRTSQDQTRAGFGDVFQVRQRPADSSASVRPLDVDLIGTGDSRFCSPL